MRRRPITNVPASVHARLLNIGARSGNAIDFILQSYAAERFLYRMGRSSASDRFTLKGATLFVVCGADTFRGTRDLDLLRSGNPGHEAPSVIWRRSVTSPAWKMGSRLNTEMRAFGCAPFPLRGRRAPCEYA